MSDMNFDKLPADLQDYIFNFNRSDPQRLALRQRSHMRYYFWRWYAFHSPRSGYNLNGGILNNGAALGAVAPFMGMFEDTYIDQELFDLHRHRNHGASE